MNITNLITHKKLHQAHVTGNITSLYLYTGDVSNITKYYVILHVTKGLKA